MKKFLERWRGWRRALTVIFRHGAQIRAELVVIVNVDPADDYAFDELRGMLPGWQVTPYGERRARLTPPAIVTVEE